MNPAGSWSLELNGYCISSPSSIGKLVPGSCCFPQETELRWPMAIADSVIKDHRTQFYVASGGPRWLLHIIQREKRASWTFLIVLGIGSSYSCCLFFWNECTLFFSMCSLRCCLRYLLVLCFSFSFSLCSMNLLRFKLMNTNSVLKNINRDCRSKLFSYSNFTIDYPKTIN